MTAEDRAALLAAVNRLVADPKAPGLYEQLSDAIPAARRLGLRFVGELEELNPLLDLAASRPEHYDNVVVLIETKRANAGLEPLDKKNLEVEKFDKNAYMADFMQRKRERERKAADIENMIRPQRDQLIGRSRMDFMQAQARKWRKQLDDRIAAARKAQEGRVTKEQLDAIRRTFWDEIDRYLDDLESEARRDMLAGKR